MASANEGDRATFPLLPNGRTFHVGCKRGEVASRILTIGDPRRARLLQLLLDADSPVTEHSSTRAFLSIHGKYKGTPVSIISIGMGTANIDMLVREVREVTDGPLIFIRFGTCGGFSTSAGSIVVAEGSVMIQRNYNYVNSANLLVPDAAPEQFPCSQPYLFSPVVPAHAKIQTLLLANLQKKLGDHVNIISGINATSDSFYSSQGRKSSTFQDDNDDLIPHLLTAYPGIRSMEMETFSLFHLAHNLRNTDDGDRSVIAGACAITIFDRLSGTAATSSLVEKLELDAGSAIFDSLIQCPLHHN